MAKDDISELTAKVDGLAVMVGRIEERLDANAVPGDGPMCAVHEHRMNQVERRVAGIESVQGKHHLIVLVLGAIGAGIGMALKTLFFKVNQ